MMTTETTLANSAPAASDTTRAVAAGRQHAAVAGDDPDHGGGGELQERDEARGEVHGADVGAVAELQHRGDQVDDDGGEQLPLVVHQRVVDVAVDEAEVQRRGEQDEEAEDDFLEVHRSLLRSGEPAWPASARGCQCRACPFFPVGCPDIIAVCGKRRVEPALTFRARHITAACLVHALCMKRASNKPPLIFALAAKSRPT